MPLLSPAVLFVCAVAQLFPARRQLKAGPTGSKTHSSQNFLFVDHYTFKFFLLLYWSKQTMSLITAQIVLFCFRSITRSAPCSTSSTCLLAPSPSRTRYGSGAWRIHRTRQPNQSTKHRKGWKISTAHRNRRSHPSRIAAP